MSSYTISDVSFPAGVAMPDGAVRAEDWQPERYRVFEGEQQTAPQRV